MRLKFGLPWDRSVAFFLFSKNAKQKKDFWISFLRNHVILWAIFRSQIRFDSQYQLREELNKFFFPCRFGINHFQKNLIWTRFLGSVFEFVIKKKVHYSINNHKILILFFLFFWFRELSMLTFCNNWDSLLKLEIWKVYGQRSID